MAQKIEIRGLAEAVRDARREIADVREHSAGLRDDTRALKGTLLDVRKQVNDLHDDLRFEVATLGNSPPDEEEKKPEEKKPVPEIKQEQTPSAPPEEPQKPSVDGVAEADSFRAAE